MNAKDRINHTKAYYERRAPWHDQYMGYEASEVVDRRLRPVASAILQLVANRSVLEVACGTGNWTRFLAAHARVVRAFDSSPSALAIARSKCGESGNVTLMLLDAFDLAPITGPFDIVFAADWYSHIPRSFFPLFIQNVKRTAGPLARVALVEMTAKPELEAEFAGFDDEGNRLVRRVLPDGSEFEIIKNMPDESELRNQLEQFFDSIEYRAFPESKRWLLTGNLR